MRCSLIILFFAVIQQSFSQQKQIQYLSGTDAKRYRPMGFLLYRRSQQWRMEKNRSAILLGATGFWQL